MIGVGTMILKYIKHIIDPPKLHTFKLFAETGRYTNVQYQRRICSLCKLQEIEDLVLHMIRVDMINRVV